MREKNREKNVEWANRVIRFVIVFRSGTVDCGQLCRERGNQVAIRLSGVVVVVVWLCSLGPRA